MGLAFDSSNNLYIADGNNYRIRQVNPAGFISTVAGNGNNSFNGDNGPATSAAMSFPVGVALDSAGNLYFSDYNNHRVRKVVIGGNITTVAGNGGSGYFGDGGPAVNSTLSLPQGLAFDSSGNLYIADDTNCRIRVVDTSGNINTVAGNGSCGGAGDGGPAIAAQIDHPYGLAIDAQGNLYIADKDNWQGSQVTPGGIISTVAGNGVLRHLFRRW